MGISFDISRQVEDAATIRKQRKKTKKLELSNKHKSEFYANLSHEMRTILNSNLLLTDILKDNRKGNLETDEIEYLEAIYQSSNSMLELLNAALDLSKIESGNISVQIKEFNISDICRSTEKLYKPIAREKGIDYQCFIDDHMASTIATDRLRLDQVLNNLISNALKFTKEGHVHLHIYEPDEKELKKRGIKDDNSIAFKISDTGIGIPKNRQKQIFKSYVQAEGISTKKRFGGTGLGLSISKEIAEILGGGIFLESEPEVGSTFTLIIPKDSHNALGEQAQKGRVKITEPESVADSDSLTEKKNSKKLKGTALLVDDSSIHNMALKEFLGFKISKCLTAETAEEAYATLHSHSVDCIILDMYLPDADGKEVLKELKSKKEFEHIPVIIYSGKNLSSSEEAELNKLAYSVVQKNVKSYNLLLDHITKIISKK
jgi:two-component system chemotaxis sensor kinase CheA